MANTFKLVTKPNVTSSDLIYTVAGSTTTVILGLMLGNTTSGSSNATVTLGTDTANRAGNNNEVNADVELLTTTVIPAYTTLELLAGNKVVMEATDTLTVVGSAALDVVLSIMEIT